MRSKTLEEMSLFKYEMNKKDLKKLTKAQLINLLLKQEKSSQARETSNSVKYIVNDFDNLIIPPQERFRDRPPKSPPPPPILFDFDDDIFQTENQSLEKFKIIGVQSRQNKNSNPLRMNSK